MKHHLEQIQQSIAGCEVRIQYYLGQTQQIAKKQLQLRQKKTELFQRIDALEAKLQALKSR